MSYLKELKQHVIEVRGHVYHAYWKVLLLICRRGGGGKQIVSEFYPLHLKIHHPHHSCIFSIIGNYSALLWF